MADLEIDCDSERYRRQLVYLTIVLLIIPIGLPLGALVKLVQLKPHLDALGQVRARVGGGAEGGGGNGRLVM